MEHSFCGSRKTRFQTALYQDMASAVPLSGLFLPARADFSPRGTDKLDLFRSRFNRRHFFRDGESPSAKLLAISRAALVTNN